METITERPSNS